MARGGRRTYTRDSRGRFASTPGGGLGAARKAARSQSGRASTLGARTSLKASRAKLRAKDPADQRLSTALSTRAQKGAVTRGNRKLTGAKVAARTKLQGSPRAGVIGKPRKLASSSQVLQKATRPAGIPTTTGKGANVRGSAKPRMTATATPRAKGSRTKLPGMGGTIAKPKGLKPGALAERRAAKAQKPINTNPTRKPRKSKYQLQIVDQANRILDKLKLRMVTNAKGFNRYNLEDRIAKVNKIAKTAIPGYRHNPMRKNSSAKSAYQERNRRYGKAATAARNIARGSEFFRYGKYID